MNKILSQYQDLISSLPDEVYPNGICPFMSQLQLAPVDSGDIHIVEGRNQRKMVMAPSPLLMPCVGKKCQLWDRHIGECGKVSILSIMQTIKGTLNDIQRDLDKVTDIYYQTNPI